jgi:ketosteroid isomerase-like protein
VSLLLASCDADRPQTPPITTPIKTPTPVATPTPIKTPTPPTPVPTAPPIAAAEVSQLVDAWLAAQNSGDLAAYLALYAEPFEGVKRSGERVLHLDRAGWVADRTKMFAKKMTVSVADLAIITTATSARLTLTQTWAGGNFKDVGPKRIVVIKQAGALRIAREEMLASTVAGVQPLPFHTPEQLALVILDGGPQVVLDVAPDPAWAEGAPELLADAEPFPTRRAVTASKLPANLSAWTGKRVRLYGDAGPVCTATLASPALLGRVMPHFGEVARWHGHADDGAPALSKAQIAVNAWDLAGGAAPNGLMLTAAITEPEGDCKTALWAQLASEPERKVTKAEWATPERAQQVLAALRKLPAYKEIQATREPAQRGKPWDLEGKTQVLIMQQPSGKPLAFIAAITNEGCGGFQGDLAAVFELEGDKPRLAGRPMSAPLRMPVALIDVGAGKPEILLPEALLRGETGYDQLDALVIPFLDCGC